MNIISLNGTWEFKCNDAGAEVAREHKKITGWMKGKVPGTVHTDLMANGVIADPFYRMNEVDVQWVDRRKWIYRKAFNVSASLLNEDAVHLLAEGLDTFAEIRINGRLFAETANMFIEHRFDVKRYLRKGKNVIEIIFDSPTNCSEALEQRHGKLRVALEPPRVYLRKAQYSFSWDWGPKLTTSGIWRNISLQGFSGGRLANPFVKIISVGKREAVAEVSVEVERYNGAPLNLHATLTGHGVSITHETIVNSSLVKFLVRIPNPELWWPNGYGEQPMYEAVLTLFRGKKIVHRLNVPFAIRTVRLHQKDDREGKSFIIEINGVKIFCKGADWIPSDNFIPRIADSTYETLLRLAKDVHMNIIRVWGGGIYEQDLFYRLCDELGLMVWQDFMYACGEYPELPWFITQSRHEAEVVVKRLRNHPSIVVWCGNNECEWLFCTENPDKTADDMNGAKIFRDVLPAVCRTYDGTRPYWRSSPFGSGFPNAESNGNHHQWNVWSFWKDYKEYENDNARFVTEFGFQAPANRTTFEEVTLPSDRHPQSRVMEHHNKQVEGTERLIRFQAAHYNLSTTFDGFIYKGQLVQAEALKCAVEHWRRRKFKTAGAIFWQLNDCWPVSSWAVVDSALRPKAGYYFAKKFFAPLLVSFKRSGDSVEVWVTNDHLKSISGKLNVALKSFDGKKVWKKNVNLMIPANSSRKVMSVDSSIFPRSNPVSHYLIAGVSIDGSIVSENRHFFLEPKHLELPRGKVQTKISKLKSGKMQIAIRSDFLIKNVRLELDGTDIIPEDNYFDVDAKMVKVVTFSCNRSLVDVRKKMRLRWL